MSSPEITDDFTIVTTADVLTIEDDTYEIVDVVKTAASVAPANEQVSVDGELMDVVEHCRNGFSVKGVMLGDNFMSLEVS